MADKQPTEVPIAFSEECELLARSAADLLADNCGITDVRGWMTTDSGYDAALWKRIGELGWLGVALPEAHGGAGLGATALVAMTEVMGRHLLGAPFLSTSLATQLIVALDDDAASARLLPALAEGKTIATVALSDREGSWADDAPLANAHADGDGFLLNADCAFILDAQAADLLLIPATLGDDVAVFAIESGQLPEGALQRQQLIDETRRSYALRIEGLALGAGARIGGDAEEALGRVRRLGTLLVAAEMTGGASGAVELTLEYLRTRKQFGKLIGSYQALKHPMVDLTLGVEMARSLVYDAATQIDADTASAVVATHMAKAQAGDAFTEVADRSIQFHGAIGFTYECHAQLFFRRARWGEATFGDAGHHRRILSDLVLPATL